MHFSHSLGVYMERVVTEILQLLKNREIQYKLLSHEPVFTSAQAAQVRNTSITESAKSLVLSADNQAVLAVLQGHLRIKMKDFKREFGFKNVRLASSEEVNQVTGLDIGSIPPIGLLFGIATYIDAGISDIGNIVFNAGSHTTSLVIPTSAFLEIVDPYIGHFADSIN